ncbi:MAG: toll/interleukin-1 receptor domain-containing protein, partial [Beggiatoa sp.]|nr:toll/interleukin-1 receptor domain-containing protein [Beggiatoa sp.]
MGLGAPRVGLEGGWSRVFIDHQRFEAGLAVVGQMDGLQDQAERQLICWSADHAASGACRHEWRRALVKDPGFQSGVILLARLDGGALPVDLPTDLTQPLCIDLRDDSKPNPWQLLLRG